MRLAVYIVLFTIGFTLVLVAYYRYKETIFLLRNGINVTAIVTDILKISDSDGATYKPVFSFKDLNGNTVSFENPVSSNPVVWEKDESVSIVYDPAMPSIAKVVSYWGLFRWTIICMLIAAPLLIVSIGYFTFLGFAGSFRIPQ